MGYVCCIYYDNYSGVYIIVNRAGTSCGKLGARKRFAAAPHYSSLPTLIGGTCLFCPPVEAMHAVTIMSLKAIGL